MDAEVRYLSETTNLIPSSLLVLYSLSPSIILLAAPISLDHFSSVSSQTSLCIFPLSLPPALDSESAKAWRTCGRRTVFSFFHPKLCVLISNAPVLARVCFLLPCLKTSLAPGLTLSCWAEFLGLFISNDPYDEFSCIHGIRFFLFFKRCMRLGLKYGLC